MTLKKYLDKEQIAPIYYNKSFEMVLTFKQEELNQLLMDELEDIKKQSCDKELAKYKKILRENNVKV